MGIYLVSIWLLVGGSALITSRRATAPGVRALRAQSIPVAVLVLAVAAGVMSIVTREPNASAFVWITLACVNIALAIAGWDGSAKIIAGLGSFATLAAVGLIALHSFSSLPVMVAGGVMCLGATLLARSARPAARSYERR